MPTLLDRAQWLRSLIARRWGASCRLRRHLAGLNVERSSAIDCGCGLNETVISRQVLALPLARLVSVDGFPALAELARLRRSGAGFREVLCLSLLAIPEYYHARKTFDVAFCLDVLEHLAKDDALRFLVALESIVSDRIVLWLPLGEYRVEADPHGLGNELELHRSYWSAGELATLGYEIELLPRFHNARHDALWAVKRLRSVVAP